MTMISNDEGFEPIHEAHAIERVAFVVQFDNRFDDEVFNKLKIIVEKFSESLPGKVELQSASLKLDGKTAVSKPGESEGIIRRRVFPDGALEHELRIERSVITFITTSYKGWGLVWKQVHEYFKELLPYYLSGANVASVGLNYVDKFVWNGNPDNFELGSLFKESSKYLPHHIFETNELWHSHTGVFINVNDFVKRLLNVDVNCVEEPSPEGQKRIVSIITTLTDQFNQSDDRPDSVDKIEMLEKHMLEMHGFDKNVLSQLITDQMCNRIDLI